MATEAFYELNSDAERHAIGCLLIVGEKVLRRVPHTASRERGSEQP
jgi:hypothetical protein